MNDLLARVVISKSGRDQGRMFVIVKVVNERFVMIVDGDLRKIENPKLKNIRHLQMTNFKAEDVAVYLARGELPANHVIKRNLKQIREARDQMGRGSGNGEG
ncbi:MAG: RNA-binding protein [Syntrophomonadaceae bacterium]|nr:KOW domain-containing RNA-binding protein [Bacillota bacterium]NLM89282.1 RNA-binding protein [Syntrophomonadaceae bacterium]HAA08685.1 RNA-binding protein [Syntrophomonas sp.]HQA49520.1 KOW domain-containing RNA-binding protein [Syntrophomonadaceae bacterium]HQD90459.1 KOW domain-containing RNA-binding protein [Syntrophomonadaceae bacterium]